MQNTNGQGILAENLIGNQLHQQLLRLQSNYAIGIRGGSVLPGTPKRHSISLINNTSLLMSSELRELIFSTEFFNTAS